MPGLVGIISLDFNYKISHTLHEKMCRSIIQRVWYKRINLLSEKGEYSVTRIHHGIINDLGNPVTSTDSKVSVIIDGEIFNDIPTRMSESEFILELYLEKGEKFVDDLNGSFVIVVIDELRKRIIIANDRTASRSFFWFNDGNFIYFAPEIKAFLCIPSFNKKINEKAIASFLCAGYLINGQSYFHDITLLEKSSLMIIENGKATLKKYWDFIFSEDCQDKGLYYYVDEMSHLIDVIIKRKVKGKNKIGILLSGGIDSRGILGGYINNHSNTKPITITWGINETLSNSDAICAKELSKIVNSEHYFFQLNPMKIMENFYEIIYLNEGLTDSAGNYPEGLRTLNQIRDNIGVDIILRGDQIFSGGGSVYSEEDLLPKNAINPFYSIYHYQKIMDLMKYQYFNELNKVLMNEALKRCKQNFLQNKKDFIYFDQRLSFYLNHLSYLKEISIEQRNPLIDNDFLNFIIKIPYYHRMNKKFFYKAIEKKYPELFSVPIALYPNDIDWNIVINKNPNMQKFIKEVLIYSKNSFDEYFNKKELTNFLDDFFSRKIKEKKQDSRLSFKIKNDLKKYVHIVKLVRSHRKPWELTLDVIIFRLLTLKVWFEIFIDSSSHYTDNYENSK